MRKIRLPRSVETDSRADRILRILNAQPIRLWREAELEIPSCRLTSDMAAVLKQAGLAGHLVRSLEDVEHVLGAEQHGLDLADRHSQQMRGNRISRLLLLAGDGAERFYRQVERLLRLYGSRVLALWLDVDGDELGNLVYGKQTHAKLLMLNHKQSVSTFFLAMGASSKESDP